MSQGWRIGLVVASAQAMFLAGCAGTQTAALGSRQESLAADLTSEASPRLARMQAGGVQPQLGAPRAIAAPSQPVLPALPTPIPTIAPPSGTKQVSLTAPRGKTLIVRAWVNGRPIFDDEVMRSIPSRVWQRVAGVPESQRAEVLAEYFNDVLDQIIEQEVIYQDAVAKLQKINPRQLDKLKTLAEQDFDKQLNKLLKQVPEEELQELRKTMQKQMERSFIATAYMQNRIFPVLQRVGYDEIKEYYDTHQSEFTKAEALRWHNVFIAVNANRPTIEHARRFAEQLIASCRNGDDFAKLIAHDDGDAKFRGGEGLGSRRGEIKPVELEEHLFRLRPGQIGPIVPLSTGVHIFRLVSRDPGGLQPLDEAVQNQIKNKLKSQMAEREYRRIVRELRNRAVVEVERGS